MPALRSGKAALCSPLSKYTSIPSGHLSATAAAAVATAVTGQCARKTTRKRAQRAVPQNMRRRNDGPLGTEVAGAIPVVERGDTERLEPGDLLGGAGRPDHLKAGKRQ